MKYIALIYSAPGSGPKEGTPEHAEWMGRYFALGEAYTKAGVFVAGDALHDVSTATSVQVRDGKTQTMDGPFAETKETLGGFYILDCDNLDDAIKYAAMIPSAEHGTIEVRPLMVFDQD